MAILFNNFNQNNGTKNSENLTQEEIDILTEKALEINESLVKFFADAGIILVDYKVEFGKDKDGNILGLICFDKYKPAKTFNDDQVKFALFISELLKL